MVVFFYYVKRKTKTILYINNLKLKMIGLLGQEVGIINYTLSSEILCPRSCVFCLFLFLLWTIKNKTHVGGGRSTCTFFKPHDLVTVTDTWLIGNMWCLYLDGHCLIRVRTRGLPTRRDVLITLDRSANLHVCMN